MTIQDLAARAGVSAATVSNAFNPARHDQLSAQLRDRILTLAAEMGFAGPDPSARALRVGRSGAVGVLLPEPLSSTFSDPAAVEFLAGLAEGLEAHPTNIVLVPVGHGDPLPTDLVAVQRVAVDACALLSIPDDHPAAALARSRGIPLVGVGVVDHDPGRAAELVGRHLSGLGHRDVAVIVGTSTSTGPTAGQITPADVFGPGPRARLTGLTAAFGQRLRLVTGGPDATSSGAAAATWVLQHHPRTTAIIGLSDVLALGALAELHRRRLRVPDDYSVCGVDDTPAAEAAELTSVREHMRERGRRVALLMSDLDRDHHRTPLPATLMPRRSSGPVRPSTR